MSQPNNTDYVRDSQQSAKFHIRWMIRRDTDEVISILNQQCNASINPRELREILLRRNTIGLIVEEKEKVIGVCIYELYKFHLKIQYLATDFNNECRGIATQIIDHMIGKLNIKRNKILIDCPANNLDSQLFLKNRGFTCTSIISGNHEIYKFRYVAANQS